MKKYLGLVLAFMLMFGGFMVVNAEDEDQYGVGTGTSTGVNDEDCDENCPVISENQNTENPKTGSFLPYVIVIGGIIFSVGAIAIAKKNNKLYQV